MVGVSKVRAFTVRPGGPQDLDLLREMLYEAVCWRPGGPRPPREEALSRPEISRYLEGWGRPGDFAVVAVEPGEDRGVGAAWYRLMSPENPGYGFVDASIPEVSIGVAPEHRGLGVGGMLLDGLLEAARSDGFAALSLSVEADNPALRLYERKGFRKVSETDGSWTMLSGLGGDRTGRERPLRLSVLDGRLAVCRLDPGAEIPAWAGAARALSGPLLSITRTRDELSVVCPERDIPAGAACEKGWRALAVEGPLDFSLTGVLASLAAPLAGADISIFAVSTHDTDYVLVREPRLGDAVSALEERGHQVVSRGARTADGT